MTVGPSRAVPPAVLNSSANHRKKLPLPSQDISYSTYDTTPLERRLETHQSQAFSKHPKAFASFLAPPDILQWSLLSQHT